MELELLREKPVKLLISLLNGQGEIKTMSYLYKKTLITYSHISEVINWYIKEGIVAYEREGRHKELTLTKKGREIAEILLKVYNWEHSI